MPFFFFLRNPLLSIATDKRLKFDWARCPFSTFLRLEGNHNCACAQKWCLFSYFSMSIQAKNKLALRPKDDPNSLKGSCLKRNGPDGIRPNEAEEEMNAFLRATNTKMCVGVHGCVCMCVCGGGGGGGDAWAWACASTCCVFLRKGKSLTRSEAIRKKILRRSGFAVNGIVCSLTGHAGDQEV